MLTWVLVANKKNYTVHNLTKYLTTGVNKNQPKYFQIEKFKFEMVQSFTYLGSLIDANNDISVKIKKRILLANKRF